MSRAPAVFVKVYFQDFQFKFYVQHIVPVSKLIHQPSNPMKIEFIARIQLLHAVNRQRGAILRKFHSKGI
jgi:hypothetical protein